MPILVRRIVLAVLLAVGVPALLVYAAWTLESEKGVKTVVVKNQSGDDVFVVDLPKKEEGIDLVLQCDEEFSQDAYKRFRNFLGIEAEPIAVPGGVKALAMASGELPKELEPVKRATIEALKRKAPRRIILTAHSECLVYDVIAAWQDRLDEVKSRQIEDLRKARDLVKTWFPDTRVEVFYAQKEGSQLKFNPVLREKK